MKRNCSLDEISDGKLYGSEDLVEVSCNGCKGQAACCHGMGASIVLDPYDVYRLTTGLKMTFEELLAGKLELNVVDGIILPNLKLAGDKESCAFLDLSGKCSIHTMRPGICRIFPLGRYYEKGAFHYILQKNECQNDSHTKMKVRNWIYTDQLQEQEAFLTRWHYFLNKAEEVIKNCTDDTLIRNLNMYLLNQFYVKRFQDGEDFYRQFEERVLGAEKLLTL